MKNTLKFHFLFLAFLSISIASSVFQNLNAQNNEKHKVRMQAYYFKIMDSVSYLNIKASSKINKKNTRISNIEISVFNLQEDEQVKLGSAITNNQGESRFIIKNLNFLKPDSTGIYTVLISFKGNSSFKKSSKKITFKNVDLEAILVKKNNINYINATLLNKSNETPVIDEPLTLRVQRLFKPLILGDELSMTDEKGTILTPIEEGIPGVHGNLIIEVVLNESDDYGTVIDLVKAPIGVPIVDESTFDQRTMWSPRSKTPIFLLIIPNILTFAMWGIIIYLIINLFKITTP
tara:strand:- start:14238 stop:15110 length:873 start_codon:yes stop_codon:yes gene_type:complete